MPRYGFEQRNNGLYVLVCWMCLTLSMALAIISLSSRRLDWMTPGLTPSLAFAMVAVVCATIISRMPRLGYFRSAGLGAVFLAFGLAYAVSGGPDRQAWLFIAVGTGSILIPVVFGRRSDEQTPERTLRIRLPWT